jgi:type IV pilus assembly protein PilB
VENKDNKKIGEICIERGLMTVEQVQELLDLQKIRSDRPQFGMLAVETGLITERDLHELLANKYGHIFKDDIFNIVPAAEALNLFSERWMTDKKVVPVSIDNGRFTVVLLEYDNVVLEQELKKKTGCRELNVIVTSPLIFERYFSRHVLKKDYDLHSILSDIDKNRDNDDIVGSLRNLFLQVLIGMAIEKNASDIHIEPFVERVRVRFRIDGILTRIITYPLRLHPDITRKIKLDTNLDTNEMQKPQDGQMIYDTSTSLRINTQPKKSGEKITMRLQKNDTRGLMLFKLGYSAETIKNIYMLKKRSQGIILMTGPTGSGKTTTLYSIILEENSKEVNIVTLEDPIEYNLDGVNQIQINPAKGLTFDACFRAILRQDPNIILCGEIRDEESLEVAINAALTGHKVYGTVHTNDAAGTITRFLDLGVKGSMLCDAFAGAVAQRLVRTVCKNGLRVRALTPAEEEYLSHAG